MALVDPNIAMGYRGIELPNQLAQYGQIAQIQTAQNQNRLADAQMQEYERARTEEEGLRNYLSKSDLSNPATRQGLIMFGKTGLGYSKALTEQDTAALTQRETKFKVEKAKKEFMSQALRDISTNPSDANITAYMEDLSANSLFSAEEKAGISSTASRILALPIDQRGAFMASQGATPSELSPTLTPQTLGSSTRLVSTPKQGGRATVVPGSEATITATPGELLRHQDAQARLNAELNSTGTLTPDAVDIAANLYIQTGTLPPLGLGKNAGTLKSTILNRAAVLSGAPAAGATPAAVPFDAANAASNIVGNKVALAGTAAGARTAGTTSANISIAADEASRMIPIAETYVAKVNPTDYPTLNSVGNYVASRTGDPNITGLATSLNSLVNSYARAINPKGTPTVSDKNHAREVINSAMAKGQLSEAFKVMEQELAAAKAASSGHVGGGGKPTPSGIPAAAIADLKAGVGTDAQFDEHFGVGSAARVRGDK